MGDQENQREARQARALVAAVIALAVVIIYLPSMTGEFIWDDDDYVEQNTTLRSAEGLKKIWFEIGSVPQYYPLVHTTFWLEYQTWGAETFGYHLVNVLLHAMNALLLWAVLRRLGLPGAWLAAVLFAVHPVYVESVAWITERKNVLSGLFYFASLLSYLEFSDLHGQQRPGSRERRWRAYVFSLLFYACALFSKTVTASLPVAVLVIFWWKKGRIRRADITPLIPFFALGSALSVLTVWMEKNVVGATGEVWSLSWVERVLVAGRALWFYAWKLLWPLDLAFNYKRWEIDTTQWWQYLFPTAAVGVLIGLYVLKDRIGRGPAAAIALFCLTLAPALGFFDVYPFRYSFVADHFQYLASVPLIILIAVVASRSADNLRSRSKTFAYSALSVALLALAIQTYRQNHVYRDLETLWRDTLEKNPTSWLANNNLGNMLMREGELAEADARFRVALRSAPTYKETHHNLAIALMNQGRYEAAKDSSYNAITLDPEYAAAYNTLGNIYLRSGNPAQSLKFFRRALRISPRYAQAHGNLGAALAQLGEQDQALQHLRTAVKLDPGLVSGHSNLGILLVRTGKAPQAIHHFELALRLDPENDAVRQNLEAARDMSQQGVQ